MLTGTRNSAFNLEKNLARILDTIEHDSFEKSSFESKSFIDMLDRYDMSSETLDYYYYKKSKLYSRFSIFDMISMDADSKSLVEFSSTVYSMKSSQTQVTIKIKRFVHVHTEINAMYIHYFEFHICILNIEF